ncbi:hypothetical protein UFOVP703_2 [uncultured Caudovirales phage]|uniref:Uncharacterized protein n=1 Tax=uncultured Caudovirales phage TaxID=2100421 RepID=A0A6J5NKZ1_9CAUD|nr:hypothetical protein UFOVP703_2 [uncultured Caudovirales phage]
MQLNPAESARRKDEGQQLALDWSGQAWPERVLEAFAAWAGVQKLRGLSTCTIEQLRAESRCHPESHKAWGALPRLLVAKGLVEPLLDGAGEPVYRRAAAPKTHAHPVRVWRLL